MAFFFLYAVFIYMDYFIKYRDPIYERQIFGSIEGGGYEWRSTSNANITKSWCKANFTLCGGTYFTDFGGVQKRGIQIVDVRHEANAAFLLQMHLLESLVWLVSWLLRQDQGNQYHYSNQNAQLAQSPLLLIGGATATMLRGRGSLQDIDQLDQLIKPHVKWHARPNRLRDVVPALEEAFVQAKSGVQGLYLWNLQWIYFTMRALFVIGTVPRQIKKTPNFQSV